MPEEEAAKQESKDFLRAKEKEMKQAVEKQPGNARKPDTHEYRQLQEININVRRLDQEQRLGSGRKRQLRRPEWKLTAESLSTEQNR